MDWFQRLPGFTRSPAGLEHKLWKSLPSVLGAGTLLCILVYVVAHAAALDLPTPQEQRALQVFDYQLLGALIVHVTLVLTVAIGCVIVMVMKGPAFVADAYEMETAESPRYRE